MNLSRRLVLKQLLPLNEDRKCWRQVGSVLIEQTVGQVKPVLETTSKEVCVAFLSFSQQDKLCQVTASDTKPKRRAKNKGIGVS